MMNQNPPESNPSHSSDYAPYPKLDATDVAPPAKDWTEVPVGSQPLPAAGHPPSNPRAPSPEKSAPIAGNAATTMPPESNPYVNVSSVPASPMKMKTGPSVADAAVGRIAQGTKILAEGGYEKVFRQSFETVPEEQLLKPYACYLSTSSGPVMGTLYVSTAKLAFFSDSPLSCKVGDQTEWSYYKVVIPLPQLKAVNPSTSKVNPAEKYIQIISVDNHEFWFMGFVNYDSAVKNLKGLLEGGSS